MEGGGQRGNNDNLLKNTRCYFCPLFYNTIKKMFFLPILDLRGKCIICLNISQQSTFITTKNLNCKPKENDIYTMVFSANFVIQVEGSGLRLRGSASDPRKSTLYCLKYSYQNC